MGILDGRAALVTGAGQGSGLGCALALAAEGASVALVGRTRAKLVAAAQQVKERGARAVAIRCDVTRPEEIEACVARTVAELGAVDVLVNAAQSPIDRSATLLDVDRATFDELWRSGPAATLEFMRACYPHLCGGGSIVNFGSGAQWRPFHYGPYAAAKAAIATLTRTAAEEWGPDGIRANVVVPFVESPAFRADFERSGPGRLEAALRSVPLRRAGDPERDLGRVVVFLAGPDSGYVTGTTIPVDGGSSYLR